MEKNVRFEFLLENSGHMVYGLLYLTFPPFNTLCNHIFTPLMLETSFLIDA